MLFVVVPSSFLVLANKSAGGSKDDSLLAILIVSKEANVPSTWRGAEMLFVFPYKRKKLSLHRYLNVLE